MLTGGISNAFLMNGINVHHQSRTFNRRNRIYDDGLVIYQSLTASGNSLRMNMNIFDSSDLFTSVETFDGSLVDPVVVSTAFWTALKGKFVALVIGQLLATIVFTGVTSFFGATIFKAINSIGNSIGQETKTRTKELSEKISYTAPESIDIGKLFLCLIIDTIGTSSELIPFIGEVTDVVWAPIAAIIFRSLFGSNIVLILEFTEEILPFTDFLPLATICWFIETFAGDSDIARALQIGAFGTKITDENIIDVDVQENNGLKRIGSRKIED